MRSLHDLPKAHLHLHLEGSARPPTIDELALAASVPLADLLAFSTLTEFVERYQIAVSSIASPADLERVCYELMVDEAAQGVTWSEPMVTPQFYEGPFGTLDDVWEHMKAGFQRASDETGIRWGVLVGHVRTQPVELAERMATWAAAHADDHVVGFGIAGDEQLAGPELFARACAIAAEAELLVVPHAGETVGPESVTGALALGAHRLAHGVRAVEDAEVLARLADEDVACDVCPTSNLKLSVVPHLGEHPLLAMLEAGVPVTLGSDDQLFFGSQVAEEYEVVRTAFGLSDHELAAIARTSARVSGAPPDVQAEMQAGIDEWLAS